MCVVTVAEQDRKGTEACNEALVSFVDFGLWQAEIVVRDLGKGADTCNGDAVYNKCRGMRLTMMCLMQSYDAPYLPQCG